MIKKVSFLSLLFLQFFLTNTIIAQNNCACNEYYKYKTEQEKLDSDIKIYVDKLQTSSNKICIAQSYFWLATMYQNNKNFDSSELSFMQAEKIFKQTKCNDSVLLDTYKYWAQLYYTQGKFAKAQDASFKLLQSTLASKNVFETAVCYTMIAQLFNQTEQAEKGIIYTRQAVALINKIESPSQKAEIYFKISKRYLWHYQDTKKVSSLDSSEIFSFLHLAQAKKINKRSSIAGAFSNLQGIAWERGDFKKALQLLDSSFNYTDKEDNSNIAVNYFDKADLLIELKNYSEAYKMSDSALYYYKRSGTVAYIAEVYSLQSRIAKLQGDYKKAFERNELSRAIDDSIRNVEKTKQVTELERKYHQAKNEKTIKELAQEKRIFLLLSLTGLFALLGLIFFIRQQSFKNKQKVLEVEQRLNRARMNPHFFFNALTSLQSFALQGNDGKSIASNLSKFSHIMRETLESTYKEYVTIEQEIDFLTTYLELQKVRFPQKFSYSINQSSSVEPDEMILPSMILQPFIENSIEHGFTGIDYPGNISIEFSNSKTDLKIIITDNGKGLSIPSKENNEHISRASQIIKDRIYLLNIKLKTKAAFSIENNQDKKGVTVLINLPLLFKNDIKE